MGDVPLNNLLTDPLQRHYLKKLLLTKLIENELSSLNDPSGLQQLGPPFDSSIDPTNTRLPILCFVFHRFVCSFPFLGQTDQDSLWRDKVQPFLESFASKRISSSEDRSESSKREKLGLRVKSMLVLLMTAGVRVGNEKSLVADEVVPAQRETELPTEQYIHGFDINIIGVRKIEKSHKLRKREHHSEFLVRTKRPGKEDVIVARRYGAFKKLHESLKEEFPGKQITRLPMKNKAPATASSYIPSMPFMGSRESLEEDSGASAEENENPTDATIQVQSPIPREKQRLTLRAFLHRLLKDVQTAESTSLRHFLLDQPLKLSQAEELDARRRAELDTQRNEEQLKFLEVTRERAKDLDAHMDTFKKQLIQDNGLSKIFASIRECETIEELPIQYIKVIEWARIEIASTLYQLFIAEDNSSELFSQAKRIHALFPYSMLKNIMRFSNPMMMMRAGIDLFLATPFGRASLFQRMFSSTLTEDIVEIEAAVKDLRIKVHDDGLCDRIKNFVHSREDQQAMIRFEAREDDVDLLVSLMRSTSVGLEPKLNGQQITRVFMANMAWTSALDGATDYSTTDATLYGYFTQLLKLYTRQRDKQQMMELLFDGTTSSLLKDIVSIFYEPLARVYKAANIHNSVMDFSRFAEDCIQTVNRANNQTLSANPNALVQAFVDLTGRHQNSFFHFVHDAHSHDDGLFDNLMQWIEIILSFLRDGTRTIDLDEVITSSQLNHDAASAELDALLQYHKEMKLYRHSKSTHDGRPTGTISGSDFGFYQDDLDAIYESEEEEEELDDLDPLTAELRRRAKPRDPVNPHTPELDRCVPAFQAALRKCLT